MTKIIIKEREKQRNEFIWSPISSFCHANFEGFIDYINKNSNIIIEPIPSEQLHGAGVGMRVIKKDLRQPQLPGFEDE
tara:strand:- start:305 stop:538 length:234 start_codon:yes stop_codon:yes gene_type:complete